MSLLPADRLQLVMVHELVSNQHLICLCVWSPAATATAPTCRVLPLVMGGVQGLLGGAVKHPGLPG
jgi:hypothetical protein